MAKARRGRHEGTLRKRKDGRYETRRDIGISPEGKRVQLYGYGYTKAEAIANLNEKLSGRSQHTARKHLLGEFLTTWLAEVRLSNCFATYQLRESICRRFILPRLGGLALNKLEAFHLTQLLTDLKKAQVTPSNLRQVYVVLNAALNAAQRRGLFPANPCAAVPKPRVVRQVVPPWSVQEVKTFLEAAKESRYYALLLLAVTSGMRQGELFGLQWSDVDLALGYLTVRRSLAEDENHKLILKEPKTASSFRRIILPAIAIKALKEHRERSAAKNSFVFLSECGEPLRKSNFIRRHFGPLIAKAELRRIKFHTLRHTANAILLNDGVSPNVLAQRMGHSTTRMTLDVYGHVLVGAQQQAADKLDDLLAGQGMVKATIPEAFNRKEKTRIANNGGLFQLVEMRRLELLTPYMRSKCSTS